MYSLDESLFMEDPGDTYYRFIEYAKYLNNLYVLVPTKKTGKVVSGNIHIYACASRSKMIRYFKILIFSVYISIFKRVNIISTNDAVLGVIGYIIKKIFKIKLNISVFGTQMFEPDWTKGSVIRKVLFKSAVYAIKKCDLVRAGSSQVYDMLINKVKIQKQKVVYIPVIPSPKRIEKIMSCRPIDFKKKVANGKYDPIILSVGRLDENKNYIFMVEIAKKILAVDPNILFLIIGDGPEMKNIENKINEYGISNNVKLLGYLSEEDLIKYMCACDIFALTSRSEGLPMVFIEAVLSGKPIITTAVSGAIEAVKEGENGYIIAQGDLDDYCRKLLEIIEKKNMFSENSLKISRIFDFNKVTLSIIESWNKLVYNQ